MTDMIILFSLLVSGLCFQAFLLLKPDRIRIRKTREDLLKRRRYDDEYKKKEYERWSCR